MPNTENPEQVNRQNAQLIGQLMLLANIALAEAQKGNTDDLLSASTRLVDSCDFTAVTSHLTSLGVLSAAEMTTDPQTTVFQAIGRIYCTWQRAFANNFTEQLICQIRTLSHNHVVNRADTLSSNLEEDRAGDESLRSTEIEKKISVFTQLLFEEGQKRGQKIQRTFSHIRLDPPLFLADIQFLSVQTKGYARTKKEAGHLAAQKACEQLGIRHSRVP